MKKHIITFIAACFCASLPLGIANAATVVPFSETWTGPVVVPDNAPAGVSHTFVLSTGYQYTVLVTVELELTGGWNGDLYAYLEHNGQKAILLNRPGKTAGNYFGSGSTNLDVVFDDTAAEDVHIGLPAFGDATGSFQPDGRNVDPELVVETSARTQFLAIFQNVDPDGDWTLFVSDLSAGDEASIASATLNVTVIPEPAVGSLMLAALFGSAFVRRRL